MSVATAEPTEQGKKKRKPAAPPDRTREAVETVVFVVVLVLLLKLFVTEAFVIPTGSMAETLYGYQKVVTCPQCGIEFPVNSHDEEEPNQADGRRHALTGYTCPNCRFPGHFDFERDNRGQIVRVNSPRNNTGDRVLVLKPIYHLQAPQRGDVVVFKFPEEPQQKQTAQNYIKRAQGFGGETIGIHRGDLYATTALDYPADALDESGQPLYPRPADPLDLWKGNPLRGPDYRYVNNPKAMKLFDESRAAGFPGGSMFGIIRKPEKQLLADARIVWDNDHQPRELAGKALPRWYAPPEHLAKWRGNNADLPTTFGHQAPELDWIRYRHLIYPWDQPDQAAAAKPRPVDNFLGYNAGVSDGMGDRSSPADNLWVGDLILECEADMKDGSAVVLELSKGQNRFQATFEGGTVTLASTGPGARAFGSRPCRVKGEGKHHLRFANVDCRLWVWVDGGVVDFGTDADYPPDSTVPPGKEDSEGYTEENDVAAPSSIGAKGGVTVSAIKLHRDIYYTKNSPASHGQAEVYYVHPGHYLCLGDNSAQSSDSRTWGLVPERLMLGKAVFVFWPFFFDPAKNRIGFIK
jgi:signal peptidase I